MVRVWVYDFSDVAWHRLPGATISVRDFCGTVFNDNRQFVGLRLFVSSLEKVKVERPAPADPFDLPLQPAAVRQCGRIHSPGKVSGVVTSTQPNQWLYLQDGGQGVHLQHGQAAAVALGSRLEVVGYPTAGRYSPTLENTMFRVVGLGHPLAGLAQTARRHDRRERWVSRSTL